MSTIRATFVQHGSSPVPNITLNASGQVIVASGIVSSGTFAAPSGSVSAPGLYFVGDSNTGIYSPAADTIAFTEGGVESLRIDSSGRVGIGTTTVNNGVLHVKSNGTSSQSGLAVEASANDSFLSITNNGSAHRLEASYNSTGSYQPISFVINGEKARIDTSGRLLIGTSTSVSVNGVNSALQIAGTGVDSFASLIRYGAAGFTGESPGIFLARSGSNVKGTNAIVGNGDWLGQLLFAGANGSGFDTAASIIGAVDGTPGASGDMPGRLVFSTTADGASSPTERMRITNKGNAFFNTTSNTLGGSNPCSTVFNHIEGTNDHVVSVVASTASYASGALLVGCYRGANSAYSLLRAWSGDGGTIAFSDQEFNLRGDGTAFADGAWNGGGADYAEYFEWSDSNPNEEDRRGISVVLDGDKIREAQAGQDPIGVISGNPSVVGDAAWNKWSGKHLRDEFGSYLLDENGDRQLNPDYDPDQVYIPREERPEWDCVGLMGKLRIRKGQVTGSRWIKMRDISDSVEEWLVR